MLMGKDAKSCVSAIGKDVKSYVSILKNKFAQVGLERTSWELGSVPYR